MIGRISLRRAIVTGLVCMAVIAVIALGVHVGANLMVRHRGPLAVAERLEAEHDARTSLVQLIGAFGLVGGLGFTLRTFLLTRQTQQTDRFAKALDHIGSKESQAARVGGIYSLWLLAVESDAFWQPTEEVLAAFVRSAATPGTALAADVQAAMQVLGRRPRRVAGKRGEPIDLRGVDLIGVQLSAANMDRIWLDGAVLANSRLVDASLRRARLVGACLNGADLSSADLSDAKLNGASLVEAQMYAVKLAGCDIQDADLSGVRQLPADWRAKTSGTPRALP